MCAKGLLLFKNCKPSETCLTPFIQFSQYYDKSRGNNAEDGDDDDDDDIKKPSRTKIHSVSCRLELKLSSDLPETEAQSACVESANKGT